MPLDPTISLKAGHVPPPQPGEVPNLLTEPGKINQLLEMGGRLAAGRALQGAMTPQGTVDIEQATKNILSDRTNPAAAFAAMEAIGKLQGIANDQQARMKEQNAELKKAVASFMMYGNKATEADWNKTIMDAHRRGLITAWQATQEIANKPVDPTTGKFAAQPAQQRALQLYLQMLSPEELRQAIYGGFSTFSAGDKTYVVRAPGMPQFRDNAATVVEIPHGMTPEGAMVPREYVTESGEKKTAPAGAFPAPAGVNKQSSVKFPEKEGGSAAPAPAPAPAPVPKREGTPDLGSGTYKPLLPESPVERAYKALEALDPAHPTFENQVRKIVSSLPPAEQEKLRGLLGGKPE